MRRRAGPGQLTTHAAAFIVGAVVATTIAAHAVPGRNASRDRYRTLDTFAQALSYIAQSYVDPIDERTLIYGAIKGMTSELDSHSAFLAPRRYRHLREDTGGEYGGVGLTLADGRAGDPHPIVDDVVPSSPAARAGVAVGDRVLAVDGKPTAGDAGPTRPARSWTASLRGPAGTRVTVLVSRAGWATARELSLLRERVKTPTVEWLVLEPGIGYLGVRKFQEATRADAVAGLEAIAAASPAGLRAVILDLRSNPGGLLDQAIGVADLFLDRGVIVTVTGRRGTTVEQEVARSAGTFTGFDLYVLVDQQSASAAEIVAAALQEHGRGLVLGLPTFGKGSVQTFLDLEDGSGLKLTTARYATPSGRSLEGAGVAPDVQVEAFADEILVAGGPEPQGEDESDVRAGRTSSGAGAQNRANIRQRLDDDHQLAVAYQTARARLGSK